MPVIGPDAHDRSAKTDRRHRRGSPRSEAASGRRRHRRCCRHADLLCRDRHRGLVPARGVEQRMVRNRSAGRTRAPGVAGAHPAGHGRTAGVRRTCRGRGTDGSTQGACAVVPGIVLRRRSAARVPRDRARTRPVHRMAGPCPCTCLAGRDPDFRTGIPDGRRAARHLRARGRWCRQRRRLDLPHLRSASSPPGSCCQRRSSGYIAL